MNGYMLMMSLLIALTPAVVYDCHGYGHHCGRDGYSGCEHHDCAGDCECKGCGHYGSSAPRTIAIETFKGVVSEVLHGATPASITEVWVKAGDSTILVRLSPDDFLLRHGLQLREGYQIVVKGYRSASLEKEVMIATEIEAAGTKLLLRSDRGKPAW